MFIGLTPTRLSFAGGGTDMPEYYEKYGGNVVSSTISLYRLRKCLTCIVKTPYFTTFPPNIPCASYDSIVVARLIGKDTYRASFVSPLKKRPVFPFVTWSTLSWAASCIVPIEYVGYTWMDSAKSRSFSPLSMASAYS